MSTPYNPYSKKPTIASSNNSREGNMPDSDISRVLPRQLSTGFMRGTQGVGSKGAKIDAANNRITLSASDGSTVGIGAIPETTTGEVGFFATDTDGSLLYKVVNGTLYFYDKDTQINYMQIGVLPNLSTGMAVAKTGYSVDQAITL